MDTGITLQGDLELAQGLFERMAADLAMILDRELGMEDVRVERERQRAAGADCVHISFKMRVQSGERAFQGCVLVPLPDALALAGYLMMLPDEAVARERGRTELDGAFKEALLELGKFLAGAWDTVLRRSLPVETISRSEGCQGVRAGIRPAFVYREGDELLVARARARVHSFEPFEMILMLPEAVLQA
jgi:hypothetical protein